MILLFVIHFYRKAKRRRVQPFPYHWHKLLLENVLYYRNLSKGRQLVFQQRMMQFLSEVYIEGVQFELEELDKILIVVSAVIPVFGFKEWHYTNLSGILLYPDNFNEDMQFGSKDNARNIGGIEWSGRFSLRIN